MCVRFFVVSAVWYLSCCKVRSSNKPYPVPSSHPTRDSWDTLEDMNKDCTEPSGKSYGSSRRKVSIFHHAPLSSCLLPIGSSTRRLSVHDYRFSRETSANNNPKLREEKKYPKAPELQVQTCHILNESTTQGIGTSEDEAVVNKVRPDAKSPLMLTDFTDTPCSRCYDHPAAIWTRISWRISPGSWWRS